MQRAVKHVGAMQPSHYAKDFDRVENCYRLKKKLMLLAKESKKDLRDDLIGFGVSLHHVGQSFPGTVGVRDQCSAIFVNINFSRKHEIRCISRWASGGNGLR